MKGSSQRSEARSKVRQSRRRPPRLISQLEHTGRAAVRESERETGAGIGWMVLLLPRPTRITLGRRRANLLLCAHCSEQRRYERRCCVCVDSRLRGSHLCERAGCWRGDGARQERLSMSECARPQSERSGVTVAPCPQPAIRIAA